MEVTQGKGVFSPAENPWDCVYNAPEAYPTESAAPIG